MQFIVEDVVTHLAVKVTEPRIDAAIATPFKDKLREIVVKSRKPVHLDMASVDFMDSSGLGAMIAVRKSLPQNIGMVLCALTPNVERVFRLTRMDSVFDIRPLTAQKEHRE
ncbi:MAG: STAS domain-containing protein [Paracoccus sp. (in: a-proteobacteria)]|uniref:STAS domain-containing protein n=1 Tax=Paracoccus sp. TaxID=267 RepID=UPI002E8D28D7|nr:STAS domain-containing protein [Pseudomonadota bacterium]